MKKPLLVANWKENKDLKEAKDWVLAVGPQIAKRNLKIIVCVPFPLIFPLFELIGQKKWQENLYLAAQDISRFEGGAYTGEVAAKMLSGVCQFCLVGHSERKKYFGESQEEVIAKIKILLTQNFTPILCLANFEQLDFYHKNFPSLGENKDLILVYEPPEAISGGGAYHPEDPKTSESKIQAIKEKFGTRFLVLYGGSVNPENILDFLARPSIDGALIGQASLEPQTFLELVDKAFSLI